MNYTPERLEHDLKMMKDPTRWPWGDVLPLKRPHPQGIPEFANIRYVPTTGELLMQTGDGKQQFTTPEALIAEGWVVD